MSQLTHLDERGQARMVDVSAKADTERVAVARGRVLMHRETLDLIQQGNIAKGDVFTVAQVAGVQAAKRTAELIPMCHPLLLTHVSVEFDVQTVGTEVTGGMEGIVEITATVRTTGKTGVEMEALTAVAVAGLTIYDMCKAVDRTMRVTDIRLVRKSGGKSGEIILEQ